ncbi:hypothetical protein [Nocardioides sp.]|uniref:hypothetical protein n=1 Tax=Nocardioides sp. TaxID=35761 RepID=UPI0039E464FF
MAVQVKQYDPTGKPISREAVSLFQNDAKKRGAERARELRAAVNTLVMPGQRSLHMKAEGGARRKVIADAVVALAVDVWVLDASGGSGKEHERRARALTSLLEQVDVVQAHLVFDRDASMEPFDRRLLSAVPPHRRPTYVHHQRHEEPLLALPDVIAWSWARGGEWRRRLDPLAIRIVEV